MHMQFQNQAKYKKSHKKETHQKLRSTPNTITNVRSLIDADGDVLPRKEICFHQKPLTSNDTPPKIRLEQRAWKHGCKKGLRRRRREDGYVHASRKSVHFRCDLRLNKITIRQLTQSLLLCCLTARFIHFGLRAETLAPKRMVAVMLNHEIFFWSVRCRYDWAIWCVFYFIEKSNWTWRFR